MKDKIALSEIKDNIIESNLCYGCGVCATPDADMIQDKFANYILNMGGTLSIATI